MAEHDPFAEFRSLMDRFKVPGVDVHAIVESGRKDIEAIVEANKAAYQGLQALARKQSEMLGEALQKIQEAAQRGGAGDSAAHAAELAREAWHKTMGDLKELAEIVQRSNADAMTRVTDRAIEHLQELKNFLQRK